MKRYENEVQITRDIDKAKADFDRLVQMAEVQEGLGRYEEAKKLRTKARNIKDSRLDALKNKLAEFQTGLLPGVITDGDLSIPRSSRKPGKKRMAQ